MEVTEKTLVGLDGFLKEHLEADIAALVARKLDIPADQAMSMLYGSRLAKLIDEGAHGMQYLAPEYLADELIREVGKSDTRKAHDKR